MSGKFLLDTNIIIALFAEDAKVQSQLENAVEVWIPSIVLGELYYGARKSTRVADNVARVDELATQAAILDCDVDTARHYALIKNDLKLKGRPIPENDIWIAAIAIQHDLVLATRDAHFQEVQDLKIDLW